MPFGCTLGSRAGRRSLVVSTEVLRWDVIDGGLLGAVIRCPECPCRSGTGCCGQRELHRPYRLPGGAFIDTHRHAEALMPLLDPLPGPSASCDYGASS
jgi:hypothetical protein